MAALKYIFAVLLIAAVWAVVLLLELPMWIAIVATVVILAILALFVILKIVRAKKAAREIEKALRAQADRHAASARPDLRGQVDSMQQEFLKAIAALKSSKLAGKKPSEALYALPWYMIIGPPGSGKSTALRQSGLRFPYQSKSGGGVQGVGGTRNCQWWMTNDAVLLDTAGRYTTEDSDRDEWFSFLDLLKKNRPKQPVNGVLVAIAVTDVSEAHPEEVHARARECRARIDEVMAKLEMVVPVYVLFTKVDLLPGFVEIFSDLGNTERRQIWGFTVPVTQKHDAAQSFVQHFDELAQTVERRAIRRMGEERSADSRDKIFQFPQYFEPMRDKLAAFVGELMADNVYAESPHLRGAYFTSGTQEGRTIDRIMSSMAAAFGVQPRIGYTTPQIEPKSYFLGELFEKVIFPDKNIAQRSAAKIKKQALLGHAIGGGLMLASIGMALLPVLSFRENRELLTKTQDAIGKVEEHVAAKTNAPIRLGQIDPLRAVERELDEHEKDGAPFAMRMGMYQGALIAPGIRELYLRTVRDQLISPFVEYSKDDLQKFVSKHGPSPDPVAPETHREYESKLRMYLLLTGTAKGDGEFVYPLPGEPGLDDNQRPWVRERIADLWAAALKDVDDDLASRDTMLNVADAYLDISATDQKYLFDRDLKLVDGVRKVLKRTDRIDSLLNELVRDVEATDLTLADISGSRKALQNDGVKVPGKYTRAAWDGGLAEKFSSPFDALLGNEWVLGWTEEEVSKNRERQKSLVRSKYFTEYISAWRLFVGSAYTRPASGLTDAQELLKELTGGTPPPLTLMCQYVEYHTTLDDPEPDVPDDEEGGLKDAAIEAGTKAAAKKLGGGKAKALEAAKKALLEQRRKLKASDPTLKINEDVKKEFVDFIKFGCGATPVVAEGEPAPPRAAVPLDSYQAELKNVRDALQLKLNEDTAEHTIALKKAADTAITLTDSLIHEADNGTWVAGSLKKLLPPPLRGVQGAANAGATKDLTNKYCAEVVVPMTKMLARYPFKDGNASELSHQQFAEFFAPDGGKLWTFYDAALMTRIEEKNHSFSLRKLGSSAAPTDPRLVQFLNRARDLQRALFVNGGKDMFVEFSVTFMPTNGVANTVLNVDGREVTYRNGPEITETFVWPGEGKDGIGRVRVKGAGVNDEFGQESKWGIFRLFEEGTVAEGGSGTGFTMRYNISASVGAGSSGGVMKLLIKPQEPDNNPFFGNSDREVAFMGIFRHPDLIPPKSVVLGGPQCE